jgi:hypothetical protein
LMKEYQKQGEDGKQKEEPKTDSLMLHMS